MNDEKKSKADILIFNGTILPLSSGPESIPSGGLAILEDKVVALGPEREIRMAFDALKEIDAREGLIMPGLINAHTHAAMTCYRGMADDLPLMEWLNNYIFPAEAKADGELVFESTLLACAEMIRSGTTTFFDMYLFEDQVAEAAKKAGMRALVGEVLYDFPSPNYGPPEKGIEYTENLISKWKNDPLISIAVEPHALYTCSPDLLRKCLKIADAYSVPLKIHLSETKKEVEQIINKYGKTPVNHLESLGLLSAHLIACHCVWLDEQEMDLLAKRGVKVVHNPESNMKLASGVAPVPELLSRGVCVALGTDGCASNNNLDMFQEMDTAAKLHKVHRLDPTTMPAKTVLRMATMAGAQVSGRENEIGSLGVGKKADIIILDLNQPHLLPLYNIPSQLVYSASCADVHTVIINGKVVMENRTILTFDEEEILQKAREWKKRIMAGAGSL